MRCLNTPTLEWGRDARGGGGGGGGGWFDRWFAGGLSWGSNVLEGKLLIPGLPKITKKGQRLT